MISFYFKVHIIKLATTQDTHQHLLVISDWILALCLS